MAERLIVDCDRCGTRLYDGPCRRVESYDFGLVRLESLEGGKQMIPLVLEPMTVCLPCYRDVKDFVMTRPRT